MSASFHIDIVSIDSVEKQEFELYSSIIWDAGAEAILFQKIHDILGLIRPISNKLQINLIVDVTDQIKAIHLIRKRLKTGITINNKQLSVREIEVLGLIMQGFSNKQVSEKLFISFETVRSHRKNILKRTGAKNTAALINHYHQTFFDK